MKAPAFLLTFAQARAVVPLMAQTPILTSNDHLVAKNGVSFSSTLTAIGATSFLAGALPPGLSINAATGVISGTPGAPGSYTVPISIVGANGTTDTQIVITVN